MTLQLQTNHLDYELVQIQKTTALRSRISDSGIKSKVYKAFSLSTMGLLIGMESILKTENLSHVPVDLKSVSLISLTNSCNMNEQNRFQAIVVITQSMNKMKLHFSASQ